jgi:hypothetical protein
MRALLWFGLAATACASFPSDTGDERDPFRPVLLIIGVDATCADGGTGSSETWEAPNDDVVTVVVRNELWADRVELTLEDSNDPTLTESKVLPDTALTRFDPDGSWDEWTASLTEVATATEADVQTTQFNCAWFSRDGERSLDRLAIRVDVYEEGLDSPADCVVFGRNSRELMGSECACAEEWSATPPADPCGA